MILDTSAVVAVLELEPEADEFIRFIGEADVCRISAANLLELFIVVGARRNEGLEKDLDLFLESARLSIEPFTPAQARIARVAYRTFGKGSGHPARLNFGDCFAYALAKDLDEPLLFKGDDFSRTDVRIAA